MNDYQKRVLEQGDAWLNGKPKHNFIDNECCPDFSCCHPELFTKDRGDRWIVVNEYRQRIKEAPRYDA
jgi:hypothetical protein